MSAKGPLGFVDTNILVYAHRADSPFHFAASRCLTELAEGPGGGHYDNLTGPYTQVGCGIWLNGNEVNIGQELR